MEKVIESMFNLYDEEIQLITSENDLEGETVIIFENGKEKRFETYEKAWAYARKHGFID